MRKTFAQLAVGTALLAAPALAQPGGASANLTNPVGGTVDRVDGAVKKATDDKLTLATREQVRAGAEIYDTDGNSVGTVQSIDGDTAIVVRDGTLYNVPLAGIYHGAVGKTHGLVTKLSSAEIQARTAAAVESR